MNCGFYPGWNIADLLYCTMFNMGIPFDILALIIMGMYLMFALWARIDFNLSLVGAFILSYSLLVMSGNASYMLQIITDLLILGIGVRVLIGLIAILRQ